MSGTLVSESLPDGIRVLRLNRPARRNALDVELIDALERALETARDDGTRVLVLEGEGEKAFCAGYDVEGLAPPSEAGALPDDALQRLFRAVEEHPAPTLALVQGAAFGAGCELASACDFRIGTATAVFCMPPAKLGVVYAPEGIARVARLVGTSRAKRMFLTGLRVQSEQALEWGLLDERAEDLETARSRVSELCTQLKEGAPLAIKGMKTVFTRMAQAGLALDESARRELRLLRTQAFGSEDAREGRAAFLERRVPKFRGR